MGVKVERNEIKEKKSWELEPEELARIRKGQVEIARKYSSNEVLKNWEKEI